MPYVSCLHCEKKFYAKPNHLKRGWGKYCSHSCQAHDQRKGRYVQCYNCGAIVWRMPRYIARSKSGLFFCSKGCSMAWKNSDLRVGENHPFWNGGETVYRTYMEKANKPIQCSTCGIVDKRVLDVHHIDRNRKNNALDNLIWLCKNCHYLTHAKTT